MAIYRQIHTCFWSDTKILDEMNYTERYFYLYLLTNPHVNQSGCYEISITQIINESGISRKEINNLLDKFENTFKLIKYCNETKELLIMNFYKYNWTSSPKVKICIQNEISKIKSNDLIGYIRGIFNKIYPMQTGSQEKEKEKEKEKKEEEENANASTPPIFDFQSILDYGLEKGADETYCKKFYEYYKKKNLEDWKLKFDEWIKKDGIEKNIYELKKVGEGVFKL